MIMTEADRIWWEEHIAAHRLAAVGAVDDNWENHNAHVAAYNTLRRSVDITTEAETEANDYPIECRAAALRIARQYDRGDQAPDDLSPDERKLWNRTYARTLNKRAIAILLTGPEPDEHPADTLTNALGAFIQAVTDDGEGGF